MMSSTMAACRWLSSNISLSTWRSQGSRGSRRAVWSQKRADKVLTQRLPTGALGTCPAAHGGDAAGLWVAWWMMTDDATCVLMTHSSKSSFACTKCTMDLTLLLQRGHLGLFSVHCWMQVKQKWQHVAGLLTTVQANVTVAVQLCVHTPCVLM